MTNMILTKSITLIGLMGAGKSAIGRAIATQINCKFVDTDAEIVAESGLSIAEIFELAGEAKFREMERQTVQRLLGDGPQILSTGGGAFCQQDTRAAIKQHSVSLWIYAPPATLLSRMSKPLKRPLLQVDDPLSVLEDLAEKREPDYRQADLKVSTDGCSLQQAIARVSDRLSDAGIIVSHPAQNTL